MAIEKMPGTSGDIISFAEIVTTTSIVSTVKLLHEEGLIACFDKIKTLLRVNKITLLLMQVILPANKHSKMSNIVDVVVADGNLATLLRSVKAAQLETELSKAGPFTVFAPTDLAFAKLAKGELADLLKPENKIKLTNILNYHVIEGKTNIKDMVNGQKLKTMNGKVLTVHVKDGAVNINGARIQDRDMEASNGVVHSLDQVLLAN